MTETIDERARDLSAVIWNGHFTTEEERRDGLEVWRRVAEHIRQGLQEAGDAGPDDAERAVPRPPADGAPVEAGR